MESRYKSHEETARRHNQVPGMLFTGACWVILFLSGVIAFMYLQSIINIIASGEINITALLINVVIVLVGGGIAFLCWRSKDSMRVEYDYTFTPISGGQADLDVAKVMGNSRRKLMTSLTLKNAEAAGAVTSPSFQRYLTMKDVKKHNWFVNREAKLYYFYFVKNSVKHVIVLELQDEMIACVKPFLGMGVWQE